MKTPEPPADVIAGPPAESPGEHGAAIEGRSPGGRGEPAPRPSFFANVFALLRPRAPTLLREDIADALLNGTDEGVFSTEERAMLNNILRFRDVRAEDVMVPRADIEAVEITVTLGELMAQFEASGRSRMPVYGEDLDDPRGMVHIRDVVAHITRAAQPVTLAGEGADIRQIDLSRRIEDLGIIRTVLFAPPSMLASNLLARMQATRTQMALVIDEYGGTDGLVSLEDILETVVGNIEDEHDDVEMMITERGDGIFYADARADLHDVRARVGPDFDIARYEEEADTIGGLLFSELGRVPARGEVVEAVPGFEFQVLDADPRRVRRVRIVRLRQDDRRARRGGSAAEAP